MVVVARDADAALLDLETGDPIVAFRGHSTTIRTLDLDPEGRRLATGTRNGEVRVWSCETGEVLCDLPKHDMAALAVEFRPGTNELVTGSFRPAYVRFFDLATCTERARSRDLGSLLRLAVSPDGERVITVGSARSGIVLDESARYVGPFEYAPRLFPAQIEFSPDGSTVFSSGNEWLVDERWNGAFESWSTLPNREREAASREVLDAAIQASELVDRLQHAHSEPESAARALRDDDSLDPALRHAALNELIRRLD